jgi:hypothetical protein
MAVSGVARPQGGQPAAVFYPLGHLKPYAYEFLSNATFLLLAAAGVRCAGGGLQTRETTLALRMIDLD